MIKEMTGLGPTDDENVRMDGQKQARAVLINNSQLD